MRMTRRHLLAATAALVGTSARAATLPDSSAAAELWVLEAGRVQTPSSPTLAPHAGLLVLVFGIIAVATEAKAPAAVALAGTVKALSPWRRGPDDGVAALLQDGSVWWAAVAA
ncbi:MAG: hypothetical protein Q8L49_01745 [Burkholderiaceae bacterium]|nr:hypothetical protein [Burkholderiaceae bacterium]